MHSYNWLLLIHTNLDFGINYNGIIDLIFCYIYLLTNLVWRRFFYVGKLRKYDGNGKKNSTKC